MPRRVRKYGLGMVRPGGWGTRAALADGYLIAARHVEQLARRSEHRPRQSARDRGSDECDCRAGRDAEFGRGSTVYQNHNRRCIRRRPEPQSRPDRDAAVLRGAAVSFRYRHAAGLVTDDDARVLDAGNQPIAGLYAWETTCSRSWEEPTPGRGSRSGPRSRSPGSPFRTRPGCLPQRRPAFHDHATRGSVGARNGFGGTETEFHTAGATMAAKIMILNGPNLNFLGIREHPTSMVRRRSRRSRRAVRNWPAISASRFLFTSPTSKANSSI